jgi:hypothetical protein
LFPERSQHLNEVHSALMANGTDIEGLSSRGCVAGFPVEELGIGFRGWSIQELATK